MRSAQNSRRRNLQRLATTHLAAAALVISLGACQKKEAPQTPASPLPQPKTSASEARASPEPSYADAVERIGPGVVTIRAARRARAPRQYPFSDDPLSRDFFGGAFQGAPSARPPIEMALGSGVIVQPDGAILTNYHVIDGAEQIKVELASHRVFDAKVAGSDPPSDLALLKIDAKDLPALTLGDSNRVRVGDVVLAIGNPLGIGQTVTAGIISAKGRATGLSDGSFEDFLQTDAPINQGNSGGALINARGDLIGINSQILSTSGGNIGIGFAIPSNMARNVMEQLIKNGKVRRGRLGVAIQPMTPEIASSFGLSDVRGVVVNSVAPNSPAGRAGIRRGDVILTFNGAPVEDGNRLRNQVAGTAPGTEVSLTILRDRREHQVRIALGEYRPSQNG